MNYEELLNYLDIEDPAEFEYFEAMADLVECDEYIEQEALFGVFAKADKEMLSGLLDEYFEEITDGLPDDSDDMYTLLDQIRLYLTGLSANAEDEGDIRMLTDEFNRFRTWYSFESQVELSPEDGGYGDTVCLRDAITSARIEKLGGEKYRYDFNSALDYEIDSYTMSFAELAAIEEYEDEQ